MDWIKEKVKETRRYLFGTSLRKSLFIYMLLGFTGIVTVWIFTRNLSLGWMRIFTYKNGVLRDNDSYFSEIFWAADTPPIFQIAYLIYYYGLFFYMVVGSLFTCRMFLKHRVGAAYQVIKEASTAIAVGDLGREISYDSGDEMGEICDAFEYLRRQLVKEKQRKWQSEAEQRRINAAFAHDIRTPLTVVKGYTEFLQRYLPQGKLSEETVTEKLSTMLYQEERLLQFSNTMSQIQQEEAREIGGAWVEGNRFIERLQKNSKELAKTRGLHCEVSRKEIAGELFLDDRVVEEVFDNLISNAVRYARNVINVEVILEKNTLCIFVKDDGRGFSAKALRSGTEVYFSEDKETGSHFGIGLSISRMLCEKHGGYLQLVNSMEGGAIVSAAFTVGVR